MEVVPLTMEDDLRIKVIIRIGLIIPRRRRAITRLDMKKSLIGLRVRGRSISKG